MDINIIKANVDNLEIEKMAAADLTVQAKVDALVKTASEAFEAKKEAVALDTKVKDEFKRMVKQYSDNGEGVTCYSWDQGKKMVMSLAQNKADVDGEELLAGLYRHFGEDPGDTKGRAWQAWLKVTRPVRVLDLELLEQELDRTDRIERGVAEGDIHVTAAVAQAATSVKPPTIRVACPNISKVEREAHDRGELVETMVVG